VIVSLDGWGHLRVSGPDTDRFLQGLCTINVPALPVGGHAWGAILNPKGRVLSVIEMSRDAGGILIHTEPSLSDKTQALLERYAVMDDVVFERVDGPAHKIWPGPGEAAATAWDAPVVMAPAPGPAASEADVEIVRVEAGILRYGVDVDEAHFPFETPLERSIDYTKGCYVGQEPVFRVHAQGAAAQTLRGLVIDGDGPVEAGALVVHVDRDKPCTVTSAAVSPRHGSIALAYLHKTVWQPGGEVTVAGRRAVVRELPLG
jgi:folate-binding protein YgfZ